MHRAKNYFRRREGQPGHLHTCMHIHKHMNSFVSRLAKFHIQYAYTMCWIQIYTCRQTNKNRNFICGKNIFVWMGSKALPIRGWGCSHLTMSSAWLYLYRIDCVICGLCFKKRVTFAVYSIIRCCKVTPVKCFPAYRWILLFVI